MKPAVRANRPRRAFTPTPLEEEGAKLRIRSESFADHYSQARQFYMSQTEIEQQHIAAALIFELSKVERLAIRTRVVSHLLNIDQDLAEHVADGLRLKEMPKPADAARPTQEHLQKSPALSILLERPYQFQRTQGRGTRHRWCGYCHLAGAQNGSGRGRSAT